MTQLWTISKIKRILSEFDTSLSQTEENNIKNHILSFVDSYFKESSFTQKTIRPVDFVGDKKTIPTFKQAIGHVLQVSDSAIDIFMKETSNRFADIRDTNYDGVVDDLFEVLDAYMQVRSDFWQVLQELIKIDMDAESTKYYSLAKSVLDSLHNRGEDKDLVALLRGYLMQSSTWTPHHFRIDYVLHNKAYSPALIENILRAHLTTWEREYIDEIGRILDAYILITYRRTPMNGKEVNDLLQALLKSYAFPALRLGQNSQLQTKQLRILQFKLVSLFCGSFQYWRIFLPPLEQQELDIHPMSVGNISPAPESTTNFMQTPGSGKFGSSPSRDLSASATPTDIRSKIDNFFRDALPSQGAASQRDMVLREQMVDSPLFTKDIQRLFHFLWQQFEVIEGQRIQSWSEKAYLEAQADRTPSNDSLQRSGRAKRLIKTASIVILFDTVKELYLQLAESALMVPPTPFSHGNKVSDIDVSTFYQCTIFQEVMNVLISTQVLLESQSELDHLDFVLRAVHVAYQGHPDLCQSLGTLWSHSETRDEYPLIRLITLLLEHSLHDGSLVLWQLIPAVAGTVTLRALLTSCLRRYIPIVTTEPAEMLQIRRRMRGVYGDEDEEEDEDLLGDGEHKCRNKLDFSYLASAEHPQDQFALVQSMSSQDAEEDGNPEWSRLNISSHQLLLGSSSHDGGGFMSATKANQSLQLDDISTILGRDVRYIGSSHHQEHAHHHQRQQQHHRSFYHHVEKMLTALSRPVEGDVGMLYEIQGVNNSDEDSELCTVKWTREVNWWTLIVQELASYLLYCSDFHHHHRQHHHHRHHHGQVYQPQQTQIIYPRQDKLLFILNFLARFDEDVPSHMYLLHNLNNLWLEIRLKYWIQYYLKSETTITLTDADLTELVALYRKHSPDDDCRFNRSILRSLLMQVYQLSHLHHDHTTGHYANGEAVDSGLDEQETSFTKDFGALWARALTLLATQLLSQSSPVQAQKLLQNLSLFVQSHPEYAADVYQIIKHRFPVQNYRADKFSSSSPFSCYSEFIAYFQTLYPITAESDPVHCQLQLDMVTFLQTCLTSSEIALHLPVSQQNVQDITPEPTTVAITQLISAVMAYVEQETQTLLAVLSTVATATNSSTTQSAADGINHADIAAYRSLLLQALLKLGHHAMLIAPRFVSSSFSKMSFSPVLLRPLLRISTSVVVASWLRQQEQDSKVTNTNTGATTSTESEYIKSFSDLVRRSTTNTSSSNNNSSNSSSSSSSSSNANSGVNVPDVGVFVSEGIVSASHLDSILSIARYATDLLSMMLSHTMDVKALWLELLGEPVSRVDWYFGQSNLALTLSNASTAGINGFASAQNGNNATSSLSMNLLTSLLWSCTVQSAPYTMSAARTLRTSILSLLTKVLQAMPQGEQMQSWFVSLVSLRHLSYVQQIVSRIIASSTVTDTLSNLQQGGNTSNLQFSGKGDGDSLTMTMGEDVTAAWTFLATLVDNHPIALAMLLALTEDPSRNNALVIRTPSGLSNFSSSSSSSTSSTASVESRFAQFEHTPLARILPLILPHIRSLYTKDPVFLSAVLAFFQVAFVQALSFPIIAKFVVFLHHQVKGLWEALASPLLSIDAENTPQYHTVHHLVRQFYLASEEREDGSLAEVPASSNEEQKEKLSALYQQAVGYQNVLQHCESSADMIDLLTRAPAVDSNLDRNASYEEESKRQQQQQDCVKFLRRLYYQTAASHYLDTRIRQRNAQTQILVRILDLMARERYGVVYDLDANLGLATTSLLNLQVYSHSHVRQKCFAGWTKSFLQVSEPPVALVKHCTEQLQNTAHYYQYHYAHQQAAYSSLSSSAEIDKFSAGGKKSAVSHHYDGMYEHVYDLSLSVQCCHTLHRLAVLQGHVLTTGQDAIQNTMSFSAVTIWQRVHESIGLYNAMYLFNVYASASLLDLKRLSAFKHFLQFFIIPGTHVQNNIQRVQTEPSQSGNNNSSSSSSNTPSKDGPASAQQFVGQQSPVSNLPSDSPVSAKSSSFVGDKRSYDVISELFKYMLPSTAQKSSSTSSNTSSSSSSSSGSGSSSYNAQLLLPLAETSRCALWMWQERADLLLVMLHHQLHEVDFEDVDPSRSEVHIRQQDHRRMNQSKMEKLLQQILVVYRCWFPAKHDLSIFFSPKQPTHTAVASKQSLFTMQFAQQLYEIAPDRNHPYDNSERQELPLQILCELWTSMLLLCNGFIAQDTSSEVLSSLEQSRLGCFEASFRLLLSLLQHYGIDVLLHPPSDSSSSSNLNSVANELAFRLAHLALQLLCAALPDTTMMLSTGTKRSISLSDQQRWCRLYEKLHVSEFFLQLIQSLEESLVLCLQNAAIQSASSHSSSANTNAAASTNNNTSGNNSGKDPQEYGVTSLKATPDGVKLFDLHFASMHQDIPSSPASASASERGTTNNGNNSSASDNGGGSSSSGSMKQMASWMLNQASAALLTTLDIVMRSMQAMFFQPHSGDAADPAAHQHHNHHHHRTTVAGMNQFLVAFLQQSADTPSLQYYQRYVTQQYDVSIAGIVMAYDVHHQSHVAGEVSQLARIWKRYVQCWECIVMQLRNQMSHYEDHVRVRQVFFPYLSTILSRYMVLWVYPSVTEDALRMSFEQLALLRFTYRFMGVLNDAFPQWHTYHLAATNTANTKTASIAEFVRVEYEGPAQYTTHPVTWLYHVLYQRAKVWMARFCLVMMVTKEGTLKRSTSSDSSSSSTTSTSSSSSNDGSNDSNSNAANNNSSNSNNSSSVLRDILYHQERLLSQCVVMRGAEENMLFPPAASSPLDLAEDYTTTASNNSSNNGSSPSPLINNNVSHHVHFGRNEVFNLPKSSDWMSSPNNSSALKNSSATTSSSSSTKIKTSSTSNSNSDSKAPKGILKGGGLGGLDTNDSPSAANLNNSSSSQQQQQEEEDDQSSNNNNTAMGMMTLYVQEVEEAMLDVFQAMMTVVRQGILPPFTSPPLAIGEHDTATAKNTARRRDNTNTNAHDSAYDSEVIDGKVKRSFAVGALVYYLSSSALPNDTSSSSSSAQHHHHDSLHYYHNNSNHTYHHHHDPHHAQQQDRIYAGIIERVFPLSTAAAAATTGSNNEYGKQDDDGVSEEYEVRLLHSQARERIQHAQIVYEHAPLCAFVPLRKKLLFRDLFALPFVLSLHLRHYQLQAQQQQQSLFSAASSTNANINTSYFSNGSSSYNSNNSPQQQQGWLLSSAIVLAIDAQLRAYASHTVSSAAAAAGGGEGFLPLLFSFTTTTASASAGSAAGAGANGGMLMMQQHHSQQVLALSTAHLLRVLHTIVGSVQTFQQLLNSTTSSSNNNVQVTFELTGRCRYLQELVAEVVYVLLATLDHHRKAPCRQHQPMLQQIQEIRRLWHLTFASSIGSHLLDSTHDSYPNFTTNNNSNNSSNNNSSSSLAQFPTSYPTSYPTSRLFGDDNNGGNSSSGFPDTPHFLKKKSLSFADNANVDDSDGISSNDATNTSAAAGDGSGNNNNNNNNNADSDDLLSLPAGRRGLMLRMVSKNLSHSNSNNHMVVNGSHASHTSKSGSGSFSNLFYDDSDTATTASATAATASAGSSVGRAQLLALTDNNSNSASGSSSNSSYSSNNRNSNSGLKSALSITKRFVLDMDRWMVEIALALDADYRRLHPVVVRPSVVLSPPPPVNNNNNNSNSKFRQGLRNPVNWVRSNQEF